MYNLPTYQIWHSSSQSSITILMENLNNNRTFVILIFLTLYVYERNEFFTFFHSPVAHSMRNASKNLSQLKISHLLHIVHIERRKLKPKSSWCPQGHRYVHIGFVTTSQVVQKFKCCRHTRTHEQHGDVRSLDFRTLSFPESHAILIPPGILLRPNCTFPAKTL